MFNLCLYRVLVVVEAMAEGCAGAGTITRNEVNYVI